MKNKYYYSIYGQNIVSEIEIAEIVVMEKTNLIDITIERKKPPQFVFDDIAKGYYDHFTSEYMWFCIKEKCIFYIEQGERIYVYEMGEFCALTSILTGLVMALVMKQRGYIPMHGGCLYYKGQCVVISGQSGSGKSTTMMELRRQGLAFMADDISMIDSSTGKVLPGFPIQKICRDVVERLQLNYENLIYINEMRDKFAQRISLEEFHNQPEKLRTIVEICLEECEQVKVREITGGEKIKLLIRNQYCSFLVQNVKIPPTEMIKYIEIAKNIRIFQLIRPMHKKSIEEVVEMMMKQILQS